MLPIMVLDTNILVAGLRSSVGASHELLQAVARQRLVPGLTTALVLEYESVLKRPGLVPFAPEQVDALLDYWCRAGRCCPVWFRLRPSAGDPNDDMVLEAALATGSEVIVTLNPRDMRDGAERNGLELLSPKEALARLGATK